MNTVCNCSHDVVFEFDFFAYLNFTLITVDNIYHSQNISSNRNQTLTVTCSHSAKTAEFHWGFKLLWLALRFQTFTVSITVSHFFHASIVWTQPLNVRISFRFQTLPASCERGLRTCSVIDLNNQNSHTRRTLLSFRILPNLVLDSSVSILQCNGYYVMVVTSRGGVYIW